MFVLKISNSLRAPKLFIIDVTRFSVIRENFRQEATGVSERLEELKAFIQFLNDECGFAFNIDDFSHRIILQKCVYIAKLLGWYCPNYTYNIYMRGPYSPSLTDDYYVLSKCSHDSNIEVMPKFDTKRFVGIIDKIGGMRVDWLEVGTTLLSLYESNKYRIEPERVEYFLLDRTYDIKSEYPVEFINSVLKDLKNYGLIVS